MLPGFFDLRKVSDLAPNTQRTDDCFRCGLRETVASPCIEPFGEFRKGILNIGEAPGEVEDARGRPWQGKMGQMLERAYEKLGVGLFEDCLNINAVNCRPADKQGSNRAPASKEVVCCRCNVLRVIEERRPHVIVLLGGVAVESVIGARWKKDLKGITRWRGWTIPDRDLNAWVCPTFHPSYVGRSGEKGVERLVWMSDLAAALSKVEDSLPVFGAEREKVFVLDSLHSLRDMAKDGRLVAIDYETTGLKPYAEGHQVVCASVAGDFGEEESSFAFAIPDSERERRPLLDLLGSKRVGKIAQNIKFEDTWSAVVLRQQVHGWVWDTMLASHVLDNRQDVSGLKFQVYVNFGVVDYSSEIEFYLGSDGGTNGKNRVADLLNNPRDRERLLVYCGMDALFTYRLAKRQMLRMGVKEKDLLMRGGFSS